MVVGKSPEWLPPGFAEKVKYKNGRKIKYYYNVATGMKYHSKKDVICATEDNGLLVTFQTKNADNNGLSSDNRAELISVKTNDSSAWLPNGWITEERIRKCGSSKGSVYRVYTELSSGSKFYSKAAVTRYLNAVDCANTMIRSNEIDNVDETSPGISQQPISATNTGDICEKKKKESSLATNDNEDELSPDVSLQLVSMTSSGGIGERNKKGNSFVTVAIESSVAEDLPPGWRKEIRTSKSGNRIRKDPYYTDPVSGYVFRSKLDALRYLKTNDIGSCICRPQKRELDDVRMNENRIPIDNVDEPSPGMCQQQPISIENTGDNREKRRKGSSLVTKDNADEPSSGVSLQFVSMTSSGGIGERKKKGNSFVTVAIESTVAEDLPPGWRKEIRTSKSGNRIRKDPYYTDPVGGYVFCSKLDALRYLKTNDIGSCACRPRKRELDDIKMDENQIAIDNVDEPSRGMSRHPISMANTGDIIEKRRKGSSLVTNDNADELSPDVSLQLVSMTSSGGIGERKKKGNSFVTVAIESTVDEDLPPGWIKEIRTSKSGNRIRKDPYYTDPASGYVFRSKLDALRYLKTNDIGSCACRPQKRELDDVKMNENRIAIDNVDGPSPGMSRRPISLRNTVDICEKKKKGSSLVANDNADEPCPDVSPQLLSMISSGGIVERKNKGNPFVMVAIESTVAEDLPPGWIKEIKTSKSGNRIRKDPYYTDPVSGYVFRSKLDSLRYLKTNDIGSCACRPQKRELDDVKMNENRIPFSNPTNDSVHERQLLVGRELNAGGESSAAKILAESEAKILKQKQGVVAVCSSVTDPLAKQQLPESGKRPKVDSIKSKKRRVSSLPLRTSKRLAGSQPEMQSNFDLNESSLRAAVRSSSGSVVDESPSFSASANIPLLSDVNPTKKATEQAFIQEDNGQDVDPLKVVENPSADGPAIPEEQPDEKASDKQIDESKRSKESPLCHDFGDSWSDPLEFALKTLRGEIPLENTLPFPSCFNEQISTPSNQADECLKQSQYDAPIIFRNEFTTRSECSKQRIAVEQLPSNSSSFSPSGSSGLASFSGFNFPSSTEVGKKNAQTKYKP